MLKTKRQILLVISNTDVCRKLEYSIQEKFGYEVETPKDGKDALARIEALPWQYDVAIICDDLEGRPGSLELLEEIKESYHEIEVIFLVSSRESNTSGAWRAGAFNCFYLPANYEGIAYAVKFAREQAQLRCERKMLEKLQGLSIAINSAIELHEIQKLACQAAVEILNADHSGLVLFDKDLSKGKVIAEHPGPQQFTGKEVKIKGIPLEEQLVKNQQVINVPDLNNCTELGEVQSTLIALKIRSVLIVPVILAGKVIASLSIDMIEKNRYFYPDEIELCKKLAHKVAVAIGKARYLKELDVLNKIARDSNVMIPGDSELKAMLEPIKNHAGSLLDVKNFSISLYNEERDEYWFVFHEDEKDDISSITQEEWRGGLTAYVRRNNKAICVNIDEIKGLISTGEIKQVGALPRIWLGAPLISRGKVLGVIAVQNYEQENTYDEHDLILLQTIAAQTAIVIDIFQLFNNERRRSRDLGIVNRIVHTISTKLNPDDLFQTMVSQIADKLGCTHCALFLQKEMDGELLLVPQKIHGLHKEQIKSRTFKPGVGLAGWVFQNGQSLILPDARKDQRYTAARQRENLPHSMLVAPVKVGERTIGVICADQDEYDWFRESDRQLVDTLTRHAGIAIERALGLNLLQEVGIQLISSEDEEKILRRVVSGAIELTNTSSGILYLISDDGKSTTKKFPFPPDFAPPPPRMNDENGFTRKVIDKREMITVTDMNKDNRVIPWLLQKGFHSMIVVPLQIGKKVVGVLYLHDKELRLFSETERSLLDILASQAAIAIYNSHLYQESQKGRTQIEALYEAFQEIAAESMNVKSIFDKILEKAIQLFSADSAQILFLDEAQNEIKVVFSHELEQVFKGTTLKGVRMKKGEGLTWKVFETKRSISTGDYHNHADKARIFDEPKFRTLYNSLAIVPLKWKGDVIGAIAITSTTYNKFADNDICLLERFSSPAAITIAIAREISFRQTLLNNSPDAIVAIDTKGDVKEFNKASEKIFGYTKDKVLNKPVVDLWGGREEAVRINHLLHEKSSVRDIEAFVTNKSGEKIPVLFSGSLLYAEDYGEEKENIGSIGQIEDQRILSLRGRTRKLFEVLKDINRVEELPGLLHVVLDRAIGLLGADSGCIMLKKGIYFEVVESYNINPDQSVKINIKIEEEVIGQFIKNGNSQPISNSSTSIPGIPLSPGIKSALVIPLSIEDNIISIIYLESSINDYFREENEMLQFLSTEAAVAVNRAQLKEESERLGILKELGAQIRKRGKFSEYKKIIVEITQKILHSELANIFLFQKSGRSLIMQVCHPEFDELREINEMYLEMEGITGKILALKEHEHIIYNDEKEISKNAVPAYLEKYKCLPSWKNKRDKSIASPVQHFLAVPIVGEKGIVFGALRVMNKISKGYTDKNPMLDPQGFREIEDVELLKTIASLLSQGLSSERKAEKLKLLRDITKEISEKADIKGIGDCVVQSMVKLLGYSACSMRLVRGDELELIGYAGFKSDKIKDLVVSKDTGIVGKAISSNNAVLAYDISSDSEKLNGGYLYKDYAKEEGISSACCVPIRGVKEKPIGAIVIYMSQAPYQFTDYEINDNFFPISAICAIALRKVEAVNHLQKLLLILEWIHIGGTKNEIMEACIDEILTIFDAHAAAIYNTEKSVENDEVPLIDFSFNPLYSKNITSENKIPEKILSQMEREKPLIFSSSEFPVEWELLKKQYSQCLAFTIDFHQETLGIVFLFTGLGVHSILPELEIYTLASAISRQLAIAFKNLEFIDEIARVRSAQQAIISAQYVSGMIHELASNAHKGKGAITYIRGTSEYKRVKSQNWKIEFSKIESAFDDIGKFTTQALEFKDTAQMKFESTLEYRSINKSIQTVLHDINNELRKRSAKVNWENDKNHDQMHAYFDEILIKQAIRNLVSNSLRWIHDGGSITIISSQKEDYISILVKDNGRGVEPGTENQIFEPYFTTSPHGYGIGLFFVKNVVKLHKGSVNLVSPRNPTIFEIKISSKLKKEAKKNDTMHS